MSIKRFYLVRVCLTIALATAHSLQGRAEGGSSPLWLRASAISPDGQTIIFAYKGDLFSVPATGGQARQLTSNAAWDGSPVWSPSGNKIAFASEREGSLDIYEMSATGGGLTRLTTSSGAESPLAYLNEDEVLYSTSGMPTVDDRQFPSGTYTHLYKVRTKSGSRPVRVSDISVGNVTIGPNGSLIFDAIKGYEDPMRKHHTSSIARDLWQMTPAKSAASKSQPTLPTYRQLTTTKSEDRCPVYDAKTNTLYWLSEENGTLNVWSQTLTEGSKAKRLTNFTEMPVRYLTASQDGTLCFSWDGELYTLKAGSSPKKVKIDIIADTNEKDALHFVFNGGATQVCHSPKGKEIAFVLGGDVYVTSLDYKTTKQITDSPSRERHVTFAEDGRSLVYDSERDGRWALYRVSIKDKDEKLFTYATELTKEERLTPEDQTCFEPEYSPDGKKIAFLRNRHELCVLDAKTKEITTVMPAKYQYSYSDGDQTFSWAPNSKYLLSEYIGSGGWNLNDVVLVPADGKGKLVNLTNSGYSEGNPRWVLGGKAFIFQSDRAGMRSHGSWGAERDLYITFLSDEAYERFNMNKEERDRFDEAERNVRTRRRKPKKRLIRKTKRRKKRPTRNAPR